MHDYHIFIKGEGFWENVFLSTPIKISVLDKNIALYWTQGEHFTVIYFTVANLYMRKFLFLSCNRITQTYKQHTKSTLNYYF